MRFVACMSCRRLPGVFLLTLLCWFNLATSKASAVETEVREFNIEVDGKVAGRYTMTITRQDDGILSMQAAANLAFKANWFYTYEYSYNGTEHWKDGRLWQLTSKCNDDGTRYEVMAQAEGQALRLRVNGKERTCRQDAWTTSYWMLADKRFHNQPVPLLDADNGKVYNGKLHDFGIKQIQVIGQMVNCHHFRVTGGPADPSDLFFDGENRLVRQEFTEQGKKVVFSLRSVKR
jgi:hypothetical protein